MRETRNSPPALISSGELAGRVTPPFFIGRATGELAKALGALQLDLQVRGARVGFMLKQQLEFLTQQQPVVRGQLQMVLLWPLVHKVVQSHEGWSV